MSQKSAAVDLQRHIHVTVNYYINCTAYIHNDIGAYARNETCTVLMAFLHVNPGFIWIFFPHLIWKRTLGITITAQDFTGWKPFPLPNQQRLSKNDIG